MRGRRGVRTVLLASLVATASPVIDVEVGAATEDLIATLQEAVVGCDGVFAVEGAVRLTAFMASSRKTFLTVVFQDIPHDGRRYLAQLRLVAHRGLLTLRQGLLQPKDKDCLREHDRSACELVIEHLRARAMREATDGSISPSAF